MTQELPRRLAVAQLKLRSMCAGLPLDLQSLGDQALKLEVGSQQLHDMDVTLKRYAGLGSEPRYITLSMRELLALARMESDHPARAPIRENPPRLSAPPPVDEVRLNRLLAAVRDAMAVRSWVTLIQIQEALDANGMYVELPAISARVRDLRKAMYGGHTVERETVPGTARLQRYRLTLRTPA